MMEGLWWRGADAEGWGAMLEGGEEVVVVSCFGRGEGMGCGLGCWVRGGRVGAEGGRGGSLGNVSWRGKVGGE